MRLGLFLQTCGHEAGGGLRGCTRGGRRTCCQRCRYDGELVFSADLYPAIAANPYIAFRTRATESGTLVFTWEGDNGFAQTETRTITVT